MVKTIKKRHNTHKYSNNGIIKTKYKNKKTLSSNEYNIYSDIENDINTFSQTGGFFGSIVLKYKMMKFNKIIKKLNKLDLDLKKNIGSVEASMEIFKSLANKKAEIITYYILNFRSKEIFTWLLQDDELPKEMERRREKVDETIKEVHVKIEGYEKTIKEYDKQAERKIPQYNRLYKEFKKKKHCIKV